MHICFVSFDYPSPTGGGGVGNQVRTLGRALRRAGHDVTVIALAESGRPSIERDEGIEVRRVRRGNVHWYLSRIPFAGPIVALATRELEDGWAAYCAVRAVHQKKTISVVEGTETGGVVIALMFRSAAMVLRLHGEMYTFRKHTPNAPLTAGIRLGRLVQRIALRRANVLIAPSMAHAREIADELGEKRPPIEVVHNALDLTLPIEADVTDEIPPDTKRLVLCVGRIQLVKGITVLLEAARRVARRHPDVQFVLAGGRHPTIDDRALETMLSPPELAGRVQLLGHVPWESVQKLYSRATVCVVPSFYESFGLAAVEAMGHGSAVVASRAGGLTEVIEDGVTGLLVRCGEVDELADGISRLLDDAELRRTVSGTARDAARRKFGIDEHWRKSLAIYEAVQPAAAAANTRHVFVSPHSDDVVLSCGGLMHALRSGGADVAAVTVFSDTVPDWEGTAFYRHLRRKWNLAGPDDRLLEDREALDCLGIDELDLWDFRDAVCRADRHGNPICTTYEELQSQATDRDEPTMADLLVTGEEYAGRQPAGTVLYFPLAAGGHVDHQLLYRLGVHLSRLGYRVRFYPEWPYVEQYRERKAPDGWIGHQVAIDTGLKTKAVRAYRSQVGGLGGTGDAAAKRIVQHARGVGRGTPAERYWTLLPSGVETTDSQRLPVAPYEALPGTRSWRARHRTKRTYASGPADVIPVGDGLCVNFGWDLPGLDETARRLGYTLIRREDLEGAGGGDAAVVFGIAGDIRGEIGELARCAENVLRPGGVVAGSVRVPKGSRPGRIAGLVVEALRAGGFGDVSLKPSTLHNFVYFSARLRSAARRCILSTRP